MDNRIESVTIVGGGTAGWLAATYLVTELNRRAEGPPVGVTVIESPNVPTVGVGEATVPGMPHLLQAMGISEAAFIRNCNASFKLGVRFVDWNTGLDGKPLSYMHPFDVLEDTIHGFSPAYHFHKFGVPSGSNDVADFWSPASALARHFKGPKQPGQRDYDTTVRYAYHLDAGLFARFLQEIALGRGVEHILDDVTDVELDGRGYVAALALKERGRHAVELVLDCTGFRGMVMQKALGVPFESYGKYMLNDRALAVQLPHSDDTLLPATTSTALGAGWSWRVPLYNRVGTGYVFSSAHRSDEEATDEFLAHLGDAAKDATPRAIGMRVGRSTKSWHNNCIAVGLSGGFIEPLESTAIYLIEMSLKWLVNYFPDRRFEPALAQRYNTLLERLYEEIRDFIVLHYVTSNRTDSDYWLAAQNDLAVPDSLQEQLDVLSRALPNSDDFERGLLFSYVSYIIVLLGKRYLDDVRYTAEQSIARTDWNSWLLHINNIKKSLLRDLPDHRELLTAIRDGHDQRAERPVRPRPAAERFAPIITLKPGLEIPGTHIL